MQKYKKSRDNYRQLYANKMDNLGGKKQIPRNVQSPKTEQEIFFFKLNQLPVTKLNQ